MAYWLMKAEPEDFSIEDLETDGRTWWTGVRNYLARNNMRAMQIGDRVIFYRSMVKPAAVGLAQVTQLAVPDTNIAPDEPKGDWSCVEIGFLRKFETPLLLGQLKAEPRLAGMELFRMSRLSVQPVREDEFLVILELSGTSLTF